MASTKDMVMDISKQNSEISKAYPKVSIIITTYNRSGFLKEAMDSVLNQTFQDFELIIVDDNSTDDTAGTVFSYKDPRIVYIKRNINSGYQCVPKNDGIRVAKGQYIAYLDDDNKYTNDHIEILSKALDSNPDIDIAYGNRQHFSRDGFGETKIGTAREFDFDALCEGLNYIDISDLMHLREAIYRVGGWDPEIKSMGDYDLILRFAKAGCKFKFIPKVITYYYHHKDSFSSKRIFGVNSNGKEFIWGRQSIFNKVKDFLKREMEYLFKDNTSLRKEFPNQVPTRAFRVNGLGDRARYENRIIDFIKRLVRKFKFKLLKKINGLSQPFSSSEARKLSNENMRRYANILNLKNKKILDVGIGGNPLRGGYRAFFENGNDYKTLDIDSKWHPDYSMDICKTDFPDGTWDLVIVTSVLEHIEDYQNALKETRRILRPGGHIILETPYRYPFHSEPGFKDLWRFTIDAYHLLLKDFEIVDIGLYGGEPNLPSLISALARKSSSDEYKKIQMNESAWTTRDGQYQKLLKDSVNYLSCKLADYRKLKILDLGCGDGYAISIFKHYGFDDIVGVDIHPDKLKLAKKLSHNVFEGDMHNLPFNNEEFEVIFASHTLEHSHDLKIAIAEAKRVLKKDGCFFVIVPIEKSAKNIAHSQTITDPEIFKKMISGCGFDIIQENRTIRLEDELWLLCINRSSEENFPIVVLDLDDFSPLYDNTDLLIKLKEHYPQFKASLFTIPNLDSKYRISKFSEWCDRVKRLDFIELLIHGYNHYPEEFKKISKDKAKEKITLAEREFNETGLRYKKIFRAPYWQVANKAYSALAELGYAIADHKDNMTPRNLRAYQYNWSINEPIPDFKCIRGHGHIQKTCGNGLAECFENLLHFPKNTRFLTVSEFLELDAHIFRTNSQP